MSEFMHLQAADELINALLGQPVEGQDTREAEPPREPDAPESLLHAEPPHNLDSFIEEIRSSPDLRDEELFSRQLDESFQLFPLRPEQPSASLPSIGEAGSGQKNSNAIKKIGRIILDNLREYGCARGNAAVGAMMKLLSRDSKVGRTEVNKRDKFNTYHLRALLGGPGAGHNLRTTRRILSRQLRRNVLLSRQISLANKALYLNTMKCSALRCLHHSLAVRLQMSH